MKITFKKCAPVKVECSVKSKSPQASEKVINKYSFPFSNYVSLGGQVFFLGFNQNNTLQQFECNRKYKIWKNVKQCYKIKLSLKSKVLQLCPTLRPHGL